MEDHQKAMDGLLLGDAVCLTSCSLSVVEMTLSIRTGDSKMNLEGKAQG